MRSFEGYAYNGKFAVGCTGRTVYLYDANGNEICKFRDIVHGYTPIISPNGKIFVVKSTSGLLAVYSLESYTLIKKFRFSKVSGAQDDGFCFSPDGELFFNIERHQNQSKSVISIYDTTDFSLVKQVSLTENMVINHIEFDATTNAYYVLGFVRSNRFVAKFEDYQVQSITPISENEYEFYSSYKSLEFKGFASNDMFSLMGCDIDKLKKANHTLSKIFAYYNR